MNENEQYYISQDDQTKGPYTLRQLLALRNNGSINSETFVCTGVEGFWQSLAELLNETPSQPETESSSTATLSTTICHQGTCISDIRIPFTSILMFILKLWLALFLAFIISWSCLAALASVGIFFTDLLRFLIG